MSKCQKNKYFIGSCTGSKTENKEFQQDLSKLMAARDAQDSRIQAKPTVKAIVPFKSPTTADIDTVLNGEF
jgi:hypothetical protein